MMSLGSVCSHPVSASTRGIAPRPHATSAGKQRRGAQGGARPPFDRWVVVAASSAETSTIRPHSTTTSRGKRRRQQQRQHQLRGAPRRRLSSHVFDACGAKGTGRGLVAMRRAMSDTMSSSARRWRQRRGGEHGWVGNGERGSARVTQSHLSRVSRKRPGRYRSRRGDQRVRGRAAGDGNSGGRWITRAAVLLRRGRFLSRRRPPAGRARKELSLWACFLVFFCFLRTPPFLCQSSPLPPFFLFLFFLASLPVKDIIYIGVSLPKKRKNKKEKPRII